MASYIVDGSQYSGGSLERDEVILMRSMESRSHEEEEASLVTDQLTSRPLLDL